MVFDEQEDYVDSPVDRPQRGCFGVVFFAGEDSVGGSGGYEEGEGDIGQAEQHGYYYTLVINQHIYV